MQNKVTEDELAQLFCMLQQVSHCNSITKFSVELYSGHLHAVAILLNLLSSKHHQENPASLFISSDLTVKKNTIVTIETTFTHFLDYFPHDILGRPFTHFIAAASRRYIPKLERQLAAPSPHYALLYLIDKNLKVIPTFCRFRNQCVTIIYFQREIASAYVQKLYADILVEVAGSYSRDVQLLQDVYTYIIAHPEEPMPNNIQIARMFYSNRQKLKELFRHLLGTSMYQLYNTTRLERAHQLISNTHLPLQDVALLCGFTSYQHFSSLFKKHFGYRPGTLARG